MSASTVISHFIPQWLGSPESVRWAEIQTAFLLSAGGVALTIFSTPMGSANLAMQSTFGYGLIGVICSLIRIIVVVFCLFHIDNGVMAIGWGNFYFGLSNFLLQSYLGLFNLRSIGVKMTFRLSAFYDFLGLMSFTSLTKIAQIFATKIDYFLLTRFIGPEVTTSYRVMKAASDAVFPFIGKSLFAIVPKIIHHHGEGRLIEKADKLLWGIGKIFIFCCFVFGGLVLFNEDLIQLWAKSAVFLGPEINICIAAAAVNFQISNIFYRLLFSAGHIKLTTSLSACASLILGLFLYMGLKFYGILGLAIAPTIVYSAILIVYMLIFMKKFEVKPRSYKKSLLDLGHGIIAALLASVVIYACEFETTNWIGLIRSTGIYFIVFSLFIIALSSDLRMLTFKILKAPLHKRLHSASATKNN